MDRRARSRVGRPFDGDGRIRRFVPFAAVAVLAMLAIDPERPDAATLTVGAGILLGLVAAVVLPWERLPGWLQPTFVIASIPFVALPYYRTPATGSQATLAFLVVLPVLWLSLHGTREQVLACLATIAAIVVAPRLAGLHPYDQTELAALPLWLGLIALIGVGVQRLVDQLRAAEERAAEQARAAAAHAAELEVHRRDVTRLGTLLRAVPAANDAPKAICTAAVEMLDADTVLLAVPAGSRWRVRALAARDEAYLRHGDLLPASALPAVPLLGPEDPDASWRHETLVGKRHVVREAIERGGRVIAVIEARGPLLSKRSPQHRTALFELLAAEAGAALERDELIRGVAERAETDGLTGLPNRRAWDRMLAAGMEHAGGFEAPLSVALLDLDRFKRFNDTFGHLAGDHLLQGAGAGWRPLLAFGETIARWGGEEFAVLMPGRPLEAAAEFVELLREHAPAGITVSGGVAEWNRRESVRELVQRADDALYDAKRGGRNRICLSRAPAHLRRR